MLFNEHRHNIDLSASCDPFKLIKLEVSDNLCHAALSFQAYTVRGLTQMLSHHLPANYTTSTVWTYKHGCLRYTYCLPSLKQCTDAEHCRRIILSLAPDSTHALDYETVSEKETSNPTVLYAERQWVPWYWWLIAAFLVALISAQISFNRSIIWLYVPAVVLTILAVWILFSMSNTRVRVEQEADGTRWLVTGQANLPHTVVARSLAVPATAKRNAMGRQLDPAAFVVSHGWVPEMVMLVLDDPDDPTPYWLIASKDPEKLLASFVPEQQQG